jgi:5-bromo-4-chloroindolyl phosphate hydrolysis protein
VLNGRTYCTIKELSAAGSRDAEFVIKDLRRMIRTGWFAEGYLDQQETCLMTDYATYTQYLETVKYAQEQREAEQRETEKWANREGGAELKETIDEGRNYIRVIKAANDALPEEEISEKLEQLEEVTSKIFDYVEQHPEKLPEIRKFMCYYMPITLKLVNAYQKFDSHGMNTSEIEETKLEIKGTLDTINKAYQNLLKKLMQADILDVSSDISALETVLAQEGLTEDDFTAKSNGGGKES